MNIHEYQAKDLLAKYGVAVPRGGVAYTTDEAVKVAAVPIEAKLLSLPSQGGTFPARRYLGDDLLGGEAGGRMGRRSASGDGAAPASPDPCGARGSGGCE